MDSLSGGGVVRCLVFRTHLFLAPFTFNLKIKARTTAGMDFIIYGFIGEGTLIVISC